MTRDLSLHTVTVMSEKHSNGKEKALTLYSRCKPYLRRLAMA